MREGHERNGCEGMREREIDGRVRNNEDRGDSNLVKSLSSLVLDSLALQHLDVGSGPPPPPPPPAASFISSYSLLTLLLFHRFVHRRFHFLLRYAESGRVKSELLLN